MLLALALALAGCADANETGTLPVEITPAQAMRMCAGDEIRFFRWGPVSREGDGYKPRTLVIVRRDGRVTVRAGSYAGGFVMNEAQRQDLAEARKALDVGRLTARRSHDKTPPSQQEGIDVYLSIRRGKSLFTWDNLRYEHPGPMPIWDTLEVFAYLARPPESEQPQAPEPPAPPPEKPAATNPPAAPNPPAVTTAPAATEKVGPAK